METNATETVDQSAVADRRSVLKRALWGSAGMAAATAGAVSLTAAPVAARDGGKRKSVVYDVACLFNTFTPIIAPGADFEVPEGEPVLNGRGTTFFVEGELYPEGTIPEGVEDWDPSDADPTGHWMCRGWFVNRLDREGEDDRPDPHVITQQEYYFSRISAEAPFPQDQLTSSGLEGGPPEFAGLRSVVGGAGVYHGATGSVLQEIIGANTTGAPNFRFTFELSKHSL